MRKKFTQKQLETLEALERLGVEATYAEIAEELRITYKAAYDRVTQLKRKIDFLTPGRQRRVTQRQRETLEAIERLTCRDGAPPTFRELARELGLKTARVAHDRVLNMRKKGLIEPPKNKSRTLRICPALRPIVVPRDLLEELLTEIEDVRLRDRLERVVRSQT